MAARVECDQDALSSRCTQPSAMRTGTTFVKDVHPSPQVSFLCMGFVSILCVLTRFGVRLVVWKFPSLLTCQCFQMFSMLSSTADVLLLSPVFFASLQILFTWSVLYLDALPFSLSAPTNSHGTDQTGSYTSWRLVKPSLKVV